MATEVARAKAEWHAMAEIAWETNRDRVEDLVAVMIQSEHPARNAQHRRGSGGDGGLDV